MWPSHVLGRVGADPSVDVGEAVVPADRRQTPVDRGSSEPAFVHPRPIQLDVRSGRLERSQTNVVSPLEELAQIGAIRIEGAAAVPREERRRGELGLVERGLATPAVSPVTNRTKTSSTSHEVVGVHPTPSVNTARPDCRAGTGVPGYHRSRLPTSLADCEHPVDICRSVRLASVVVTLSWPGRTTRHPRKAGPPPRPIRRCVRSLGARSRQHRTYPDLTALLTDRR